MVERVKPTGKGPAFFRNGERMVGPSVVDTSDAFYKKRIVEGSIEVMKPKKKKFKESIDV